MIYRLIQPSLYLSDFIKDYQLLVFDFEDQAAVPVKPYPVSPEQGITFYVRGSITAGTENEIGVKRAKTVVFGQSTQRQNLKPSANFTMFNVLFKPGALTKFLRIPLSEFVHQNIDAELIWGNEITTVNDNLQNAKDNTDMFNIVEQFLAKRISLLKFYDSRADGVAQHIFDHPERFNLSQLADKACLSSSRFEKNFIRQMGVTPKFYARVCRFYKAYQVKQFQPTLSWLDIAWTSGYHDYQHMVKDFKEFSFNTPKSFMEEMAGSPNLVFGLLPPKGYL